MDFEDRLRNQLHGQSAKISIEPEGIDVLADRVRTRRGRRTGAAVLAALVLVAGLTTFLVSRGTDEPGQVATEGPEQDAAQRTDDPAASAQTDGSAGNGGGGVQDLPDVAPPEPGAALTFRNVGDELSPGGYNVWTNGRAGDIYYVLSTAPGTTWQDFEDDQGYFGPDTLYTWSGDGWKTSAFGDRFVSELSSDDRGLLYAISTGSTGGNALEAGVSIDGGETWTWTPVDLGDQFGDEMPFGFQARSASNGDAQLVVVHRDPGVEWEEGIRLAQEYGVDVDPETDEIFEIDSVGIAWVPDVYEVSECNAAYNEYFDTRFSDADEGLFEAPPVPYEGDLIDEEREELRRWEEEQNRLWTERRQDAVDHMRTLPGCEEYHVCLAESYAREIELQETSESIAVFEDLEGRAEAGEEISDEEWMAAEELASADWKAHEEWMEESGCRVILYGDYSEPDESDVQRITWEELGVEARDAWSASTHAYLISGGEVRALGPQFESSTGWLVEVGASGNGFEVVFDDTRYKPFEEEQEPETVITTWNSPDGLDWSSTSSSNFPYEYEAARVGGSSFAIVWADDGSDLVRTNPNGSSDRLLLSDLAPGVDTSGYEIVGVDGGPYGVVVWASKWEDPESARAGEEFDYNPDSIILYSPDGRGWGATPIDGADIAAVVVGRSDVMVFLADPDFNGTDTPPQPVLLGTSG